MTYRTILIMSDGLLLLGFNFIFWLCVAICDAVLDNKKIGRYVRWFFLWYTRFLMTVLLLIVIFILGWLYETANWG